ncbi:MAG TPA: hypothetical protein VGP87_10230, partial [Gemmatimonadales bacterium]|nr:hypothetical protein [Gemmatimonadales bacterium]
MGQPVKRRIAATAIVLLLHSGAAIAAAQSPRFEVVIPSSVHAGPLTGRLVLVLAKRDTPEPRFAISPSGPAMFGVELEQLPSGRAA